MDSQRLNIFICNFILYFIALVCIMLHIYLLKHTVSFLSMGTILISHNFSVILNKYLQMCHIVKEIFWHLLKWQGRFCARQLHRDTIVGEPDCAQLQIQKCSQGFRANEKSEWSMDRKLLRRDIGWFWLDYLNRILAKGRQGFNHQRWGGGRNWSDVKGD